jgi:uncharacterized membrane protein (DUF2068 family)
MATHVKVIAALYFAISALLVMGAVFSQMLVALGVGLLSQSNEEGAQTGAAVVGFTGVMISIMLVIFAVPFIVAGWGLLKFRPWARIFGIVLAVLCLIHVPFGTLLGIYALVILFKKETEALFVQG